MCALSGAGPVFLGTVRAVGNARLESEHALDMWHGLRLASLSEITEPYGMLRLGSTLSNACTAKVHALDSVGGAVQ